MSSGFGIYFLENDEIKLINFDIISSSDEKQDANSVVRDFRILRKQEFFSLIQINSWIVWSDCGLNYLNYTLTYLNEFYFESLKRKKFQEWHLCWLFFLKN